MTSVRSVLDIQTSVLVVMNTNNKNKLKKGGGGMNKATVEKKLNNIIRLVDKAYEGVDEYAATLEDPVVITEYLDKIYDIVYEIKGMK